MNLAGVSVNLRVRWWIEPPRARKLLALARRRARARSRQRSCENGIDLPFPTQHVLFHDQTEETDGDRTRQREGWPAGKSEAPKPRSIAAALRRREQPKENGPRENRAAPGRES